MVFIPLMKVINIAHVFKIVSQKIKKKITEVLCIRGTNIEEKVYYSSCQAHSTA